MPLIQWTLDLNTGFPDIDEQHQALVEHINIFYEAVQSGDRSRSCAALQDLVDCTVHHFAYEEAVLEKAGYHLQEAHKRVHQNFLNKAGTLKSRYDNGDDAAAKELLDILEGWLFRHIRINDHGFIESVKKAGLYA